MKKTVRILQMISIIGLGYGFSLSYSPIYFILLDILCGITIFLILYTTTGQKINRVLAYWLVISFVVSISVEFDFYIPISIKPMSNLFILIAIIWSVFGIKIDPRIKLSGLFAGSYNVDPDSDSEREYQATMDAIKPPLEHRKYRNMKRPE